MNTQEALKILELHNDWRRGRDIEQENPNRLGVAIDNVIASHKRQQKAINEIESAVERWQMGRDDTGDTMRQIHVALMSLGLLSFWNDKKP